MILQNTNNDMYGSILGHNLLLQLLLFKIS